MQESWVRSVGQEDAPDKGMATHSNILAWRIPWTEEPHRLQSMGSQRVRHDCGTNITTTTTIFVMSLNWCTVMNPTILLLCIKIMFHFYYSSHVFDLFSEDYLLVSRSQVTWSGSVSGLRMDDPVAPTGLPPLLVPWAVWAVTESANTEEEPSRALPFWAEDRIGEGEKRLWGHCWLRGYFMRRTEAGGVDLFRLTGQDLLSAVGCRQGFLW